MAFQFLSFLSTVFGWVYTICWSLSFYPQPILNFQRQSTTGTTIDFPLINSLGFLAYLVSNLAFFHSPLIRAQYAARHHGLTPTVRFNDIAFAAHGLLLSLIVTSQYIPRVWGFSQPPTSPESTRSRSRARNSPGGRHRPSRIISGVALGCIAGVVTVLFLVLTSPERASTEPTSAWVWLDVVYAVSYVKLLVTVIKYTPQVIVNYRNRSTRGWSIWQILLDFGGGVLSTAQLAVDSYLQGDWSGVTGNPVKFALGNVSVFYDIIFMAQHYILYGNAGEKWQEAGPLLSDYGDEERRID
ncbi:hypothetical protein VTK73DRAFT_10229 [Phialemonium thermophilum]|uniref:Cystinosin n=1 Tax=Phialemonium thermophilum TaxID=223376 RepID=A0ABR3XH31_9PEZI